jgi:hypothetical protein
MSKISEKIEGPFVPLLNATRDTPAWRALSHGARSLYVELKAKYNAKYPNNGKLYVSERKAAWLLNSDRKYVRRWFAELQYYGFIVMTRPGFKGLSGRATLWRLTELKTPDPSGESIRPTRNFLKWDGTKFDPEKHFPRGQKSSGPDDKSTPVPGDKSHPVEARTGGQKYPKGNGKTGGQKSSISSLTTTGAGRPGNDDAAPPTSTLTLLSLVRPRSGGRT